MKKSFTILEILVVLSVIAVLVGIAVPKFKGMQDESKMTQVKRELKTLQAAIESYSMNFTPKAYPPTSSTVSASSLISAVPQIISRVLYDPFGAAADSEYDYILSDNQRYYVICSAGPDRVSTTAAISDAGNVFPGGDDICTSNGVVGVPVADGGACSVAIECSSGYCGAGICTDGSNSSPCSAGTDCVNEYCGAGICTDGTDGSSCWVGTDCINGYCGTGTCTDGSEGSPCSAETDCVSEYCESGTCATQDACTGTATAPTIGQGCIGGAKYAGGYSGSKYMTTPGGCTDSSAPVCAGGTDSTRKKWANNTGTTAYNVIAGATSTSNGSVNTAILATNYTDTDAAKYCNNMSYGGYTDWFLPSRDEYVAVLNVNRAAVGGFHVFEYWTSTETGTTSATTILNNGNSNNVWKQYITYLRCVRKY